ncbi:hypothetical protein ASG90_14220 [Nocardioides sp. Soil797]|nr:hypothetical protein ASG90_14220 [Nocardioides sp. Soil797]
MMWFFAILAVLALAGVALVASGWGSPMAEVHTDRPDLDLAAGRTLTGTHLRQIRFSTAVRGYRMSEVDALLSQLARQLEDAGSVAPGPTAGPAGDPAVEPGEATVHDPTTERSAAAPESPDEAPTADGPGA